MASDAFIQFDYHDKNTVATLKILSQGKPEELIPEIRHILQKIDNDGHESRLNWDYLATKAIGQLISNRDLSKLVSTTEDHGPAPIFKITLTPIENAYSEKSVPIDQAIHIKASTFRDDATIFEGTICHYSPAPHDDEDYSHLFNSTYRVVSPNGFLNAVYAEMGCSEHNTGSHYKGELKQAITEYPRQYPAFVHLSRDENKEHIKVKIAYESDC